MDYFEFFHAAPILATILTLVYACMVVFFIYMLVQIYKKHL